MAFDAAVVTQVRAGERDGLLWLAWDATVPAGTAFQVYAGGVRVWAGTARAASIPPPSAAPGVVIGAVGPGEAGTDFAGSLPAPPGGGNRARLTWAGGTYLDPSGRGDVASYRVYGAAAPGGPVDDGTVLVELPAYLGPDPEDGAGVGGAGQGGAGMAASTYEWMSGPLPAGAWDWAIKAVDAEGDESTAATATVTIAAPPAPPAADEQGRRLTYSYDPVTRVATLHWLASPG